MSNIILVKRISLPLGSERSYYMSDPTFQISTEAQKPGYGLFVIEPLEQGYGQTLGNSLRRVLLGSLPGAAVTSVKITGVQHQLSTLPGLKEDIA
ncbi:MAG: hypothetical protein ACD_81C00023G0001, partial [uncultured bacterium]